MPGGWRLRLNLVAGVLLFALGVRVAGCSGYRYLIVAAGAAAGMVVVWILRGRVVRPVNFAIAGALGGWPARRAPSATTVAESQASTMIHG